MQRGKIKMAEMRRWRADPPTAREMDIESEEAIDVAAEPPSRACADGANLT